MDENKEINHPGIKKDASEKPKAKKAAPKTTAKADAPKKEAPSVEVPKTKEEPKKEVPKVIPNIWQRAEAFDCDKEKAYMANVRRGTLLKVGSSLTFIPGATPTFRPELPKWGHVPGLGHILLPV